MIGGLFVNAATRWAKPDPDLFVAAAARLGVPIEESVVVGDSVWDLLAARLARRSAWVLSRTATDWRSSSARVRTGYTIDPADLMRRPDEVGVLSPSDRWRIAPGLGKMEASRHRNRSSRLIDVLERGGFQE